MKHLPDGMHTVHACCSFFKFIICNMKYEIRNMRYGRLKYDRRKEEGGRRKEEPAISATPPTPTTYQTHPTHPTRTTDPTHPTNRTLTITTDQNSSPSKIFGSFDTHSVL
jgi:hypothetical protein